MLNKSLYLAIKIYNMFLENERGNEIESFMPERIVYDVIGSRGRLKCELCYYIYHEKHFHSEVKLF